MSDDPLMLNGLDAEVIAEAVESKKTTKRSKDPVAQRNAETAAKREERLASGRMPLPEPQPPLPEKPEKPKDKSLMLDKIQGYRDRFPNLKSRNKLSGRSTVEEIEDELHYCEQQLGQNEGHMAHHIFVLAMTGLEETTRQFNPLNLNLTGLGQVAAKNQEQFAPLLDELMIKYAVNMYVGPEMRLAMACATLIYTVHAANSGQPAVAQAMHSMSKVVDMPVAKDL
jgi:hypothetical protein